MTMKALLIPISPSKDLGDVLQIARSEGKRLFKTRENVKVVWAHDTPYGWVVVVQLGSTKTLVVSGGERE